MTQLYESVWLEIFVWFNLKARNFVSNLCTGTALQLSSNGVSCVDDLSRWLFPISLLEGFLARFGWRSSRAHAFGGFYTACCVNIMILMWLTNQMVWVALSNTKIQHIHSKFTIACLIYIRSPTCILNTQGTVTPPVGLYSFHRCWICSQAGGVNLKEQPKANLSTVCPTAFHTNLYNEIQEPRYFKTDWQESKAGVCHACSDLDAGCIYWIAHGYFHSRYPCLSWSMFISGRCVLFWVTRGADLVNSKGERSVIRLEGWLLILGGEDHQSSKRDVYDHFCQRAAVR
jgi:hypothetical protein